MKNQKQFLRAFLLLAFAFFGMGTLKAQLLFEENFDYPAGDNLSAHGWTVHNTSGSQMLNIANPGLTFDSYIGSGIGNLAALDTTGIDIHHTFPQINADSIYAAFMVKAETTNSAGYFLHFGQTTIGSTFFTRVWVKATGDGLALGGSSIPSSWVSITPNTSVLVVIKYNYSTKVSSLFVFNTFPSSEPTLADQSFTETATLSNVGSIALRQYNAAQRIYVDGIRVAKSWADAVAPAVLTPTATFNPANAQTNVAINSNIDITFSEAVRNVDDSPISAPASLITLKLNDAAGADVPFTASLDATNTIFTIDPVSDLLNNQLYYVAISSVEDADNNATSTLSSTFTTIGTDFSAPIVDTAYATGLSEVWVVFDEPVNASAENVLNYSGLPGVASAIRVATLDSVKLTLSSPLTFGIPDTVCVNNISDIPGNTMSSDDCHQVQFGVLDVIPPVAVSAWVVDFSTVKVKFNETVNTSAEVTTHYTGLPGVASAVLNTTNDTVTLNLSPSLISGISDTLFVTGVEDVAGNPMTIVYEFPLFKDTSTTPINWVITEIMYNSPESGVDSLEFIEVKNNGLTVANFRNYSIKYGASSYTHTSDLMVNPGEYLLFGIKAAKSTAFYGQTFVQGPSTGISNGGTTVKIVSPLNVLIDSVPFTTTAPWPTEANGNGYSLSLCDPNSDNALGSNWSLGSIAFGTVNGKVVYANPGEGCAPAVDTVAPVATSAWLSGFSVVKVRFNEEVNATAENIANYNGLSSIASAMRNASNDTVTLTLATPLLSGVADTLYVTAIEDLAGNAMDTTYMFTLLLDTSTTVPQIVITEIMYNSPESNTDTLEFIEVFNNGSTMVDLLNYDVYFGTSYANIGVSVPLDPGAYAIISNKVAQVNAFYSVSAVQGPLGALTNTGSVVKLLNASGVLVDSVSYGVNGNWPPSPNGGGASLTLCDPDADNTDGSNWSASTNFIGTINSINVYADPMHSCITEGIADSPMENVLVYPNPSSDVVNFSFSSQSDRVLELYSVSGTLLKSVKSNSELVELSVADLTNGMYIVRIYSDNGQYSTLRINIVK